MGSLLKASCPCGYESKTIPVGGGFATVKTACTVPAICSTCKEAVGVNILRSETACSKCGEAAILYGGLVAPDAKPHRGIVFDWAVTPTQIYVLEDRTYRCPKCGQVTMRFRTVGCWD